jgi:endonuclease III
MRGATECAKRLKLLFGSLRSRLGKPGHLPSGDPIMQLLLGILSRDTPESKASEGLDRLRATVVDYNELRVIPPIELAETLGDFPDARLKCEDISRALNAIFALEHTVSLERLSGMSRKEAQTYLDKIDGLEAYTRARIRLLGVRQHAIPLDEAMWALARREKIVAAKCTLDEAQQFLERYVAEEDAVDFVALFKKHAWNELGSAVRKGQVERIRSVPPDRSTRNMLQMVSLGVALDGADDLLPEAGELDVLGSEAGIEGHAEPGGAALGAAATAVAGRARDARPSRRAAAQVQTVARKRSETSRRAGGGAARPSGARPRSSARRARKQDARRKKGARRAGKMATRSR